MVGYHKAYLALFIRVSQRLIFGALITWVFIPRDHDPFHKVSYDLDDKVEHMFRIVQNLVLCETTPFKPSRIYFFSYSVCSYILQRVIKRISQQAYLVQRYKIVLYSGILRATLTNAHTSQYKVICTILSLKFQIIMVFVWLVAVLWLTHAKVIINCFVSTRLGGNTNENVEKGIKSMLLMPLTLRYTHRV